MVWFVICYRLLFLYESAYSTFQKSGKYLWKNIGEFNQEFEFFERSIIDAFGI